MKKLTFDPYGTYKSSRTRSDWTRLYRTYRKDYRKKYLQIQKRKPENRVELDPRMTRDQFITNYEAIETELKKQQSKGKIKVLNTMRILIQDQENYEFSYKQSKEIKKALEDYGHHPRLIEIRTGSYSGLNDFWDMVKKYSETRDYTDPTVGMVFFGS